VGTCGPLALGQLDRPTAKGPPLERPDRTAQLQIDSRLGFCFDLTGRRRIVGIRPVSGLSR
jgi:hypothetical protein